MSCSSGVIVKFSFVSHQRSAFSKEEAPAPVPLVSLEASYFLRVSSLHFVHATLQFPTDRHGMVKRMGSARWKQLYRLAYMAPLLGVIHFTWRVKKAADKDSRD